MELDTEMDMHMATEMQMALEALHPGEHPTALLAAAAEAVVAAAEPTEAGVGVVGGQSLRVAQLRGMLETLRGQASALRRVITVDARRIANAGRHGYGDGAAFVGDIADLGSTTHSAVGADIAFRRASMEPHGLR